MAHAAGCSSQVHAGLARPCLPARSPPRRGGPLRVRAAEDNSAPAPAKREMFNVLVRDIPLGKDTETFSDVMAFAGAAPERVNGRLAMWAFLFLVLTERGEHIGVLEQVSKHPFAAISTTLYIAIASIVPKIVSGRPLADLHAAASREGLPKQLRFFNKTHEIWVGRVAMLGVVGLAAVELLLKGGEPLFG